jgi:polyisoprenoid-binding protein YceI
VDDWNPEGDRRRLESVHVGPYEIRVGDRVRLRPRARADILDLALAGMTATVEAVEQDFDGRVYLAVTVDDDPGKDLGALRQPGHRFFFGPDEVEPWREAVRMTPRYRFDPGHSRFTVQAFATGLLSFLGHSPTLAVRDFRGVVEFPDDLIANLRVELTAGAGTLAVTDAVKPSDRREIEERMRADVLETAAFPEITFRAAAVESEKQAPGRYRTVLAGDLALHGVARPLRVGAELAIFADGLRLRGETRLRMSEFAIRTVTALGGTIRLQDEVKLSFDLAALPEPS